MTRPVGHAAAALVMAAVVLWGCGSSGSARSVAAFCETVVAPNDEINYATVNLQPPAAPADVKRAADTIVTQTKKILDTNPPKDIKPAYENYYQHVSKLRRQLAANNYAPSATAIQDSRQAGDKIHAYLHQHCRIPLPVYPDQSPQGTSTPPPQPPAPNVIVIHWSTYSDNTVAPGTQVTVENLDAGPHSVTADDNSFDTGPVNPTPISTSSGRGQQATVSFTAPAKPGRYPYHDSLHPEVRGVLTVSG